MDFSRWFQNPSLPDEGHLTIREGEIRWGPSGFLAETGDSSLNLNDSTRSPTASVQLSWAEKPPRGLSWFRRLLFMKRNWLHVRIRSGTFETAISAPIEPDMDVTGLPRQQVDGTLTNLGTLRDICMAASFHGAAFARATVVEDAEPAPATADATTGSAADASRRSQTFKYGFVPLALIGIWFAGSIFVARWPEEVITTTAVAGIFLQWAGAHLRSYYGQPHPTRDSVWLWGWLPHFFPARALNRESHGKTPLQGLERVFGRILAVTIAILLAANDLVPSILGLLAAGCWGLTLLFDSADRHSSPRAKALLRPGARKVIEGELVGTETALLRKVTVSKDHNGNVEIDEQQQVDAVLNVALSSKLEPRTLRLTDTTQWATHHCELHFGPGSWRYEFKVLPGASVACLVEESTLDDRPRVVSLFATRPTEPDPLGVLRRAEVLPRMERLLHIILVLAAALKIGLFLFS